MAIGDNEYRPSPTLLQRSNSLDFTTPSAINRCFRPRRSGLVYDTSMRDQSPLVNCLPSDKDESDTEQWMQKKRRKLASGEGGPLHSKGGNVEVEHRLLVCIKLSPDKLAKLPSYQSVEDSSCTDKNSTNMSNHLSSATVKAIAVGFQKYRKKYNQAHDDLTKRYSELKRQRDSELGKRDDEINRLKNVVQKHTVLLVEAKQKIQDAQLHNERYEAARQEIAKLREMKVESDSARISQNQQHKEQLDSLYERERRLRESFTKISDELRLLRQRDELQVKEVEKIVYINTHSSGCECPALKEAREHIAELERERVSLMRARDRTFLEKEEAVEKAEILGIKIRTTEKERNWWEQEYRRLLAEPPTPSLSHLGP